MNELSSAAVTQYIDLLGDDKNMPAIKTALNGLGYNHRKRGVNKDQFQQFTVSVLNYVKAHAAAWNDQADAAWNKAFEEMFKIVFSSLDGNPVH